MDAIVSKLLEEIPVAPKTEATGPAQRKPELEDFDGDVSPARKLHARFLGTGGSGTGRSPNWVVHAMAIKAIDRGRLKRGQRKFLCSAKVGWGRKGVAGEEPVSCPECLSRIERYGLSVCDDPAVAGLLTSY